MTIKIASGYLHNGVVIRKSDKRAYKWYVQTHASRPVGFQSLQEAKDFIDSK